MFARTVDGGWRLRRRAVPFLWGVAANDHWFQLPAVIQTYQDSSGEKRMGINPNWSHGVTEDMDQQLFDWFDIFLLKAGGAGYSGNHALGGRAG